MNTAEYQNCEIDGATAKALAMVAIEMILTLGQRLGKGFDLDGYADTIANVDTSLESRDVERQARENVVLILRQLAANSFA